MKNIILLIFVLSIFSSCREQKRPVSNVLEMNWDEIEEAGKNSSVNFMMWQGDPYINSYMKDYIVPKVKEQYGIDLQVLSGQGNQLVSLIMKEFEASKTSSEIDMMWINGETFYQLRQVDGLFGPFTEKLPNASFIDFDNKFIGTDFQQKVDGYECPWGNVQMALIYNSKYVEMPPSNRKLLEEYVKKFPGTFTIGTDFTGMTFLKSLLIEFAGGEQELAGAFDEEKYQKYSKEMWFFINKIKKNFWKQGKTFPENVAQMHRLYSNGELYITMSNNDGEVDNKVIQGLFPETSRAYIWEAGTIQNSHFIGISKNAVNHVGAMLVINFMISPEAQLRKMDPEIWGDGTVLSMNKLSDEWKRKFQNVPNRKYSPLRKEINQKALEELAPEYMIRLFEDFRKEVINK